MNKDFKKRNIVILLFGIVLIIIILGSIIKNNDNLEEINNNTVKEVQKQTEVLEVKEIKDLYNIENNIKKLLNEAEIDEDIIKNLNIEGHKNFYINNAKYIDINSKNIIYFAEGIFVDIEKRNKEKAKITIIVDKQNSTFSISKYGQEYQEVFKYSDDTSEITFDTDKKNVINVNIEYKSYNYWSFNQVTEEQLARRYYEDFKMNILYFPEDAYGKIDEKYKKERFGTLENYKKYLQKYQELIEEAVLSEYSIDNIGEYTEITLVDTYQNNFIIRIKENLMEYTMFLDNYTIKSEGYDDRYNKLTESRKIQTNIAMFMSMINTGDYTHAYSLLDESFKSDKFNTVQLFEKYIDNNFFKYNIVSIKKIEKQGLYYICSIGLKNNSGSASENKDLTIIMKLLEGTDFVMSFNIK